MATTRPQGHTGRLQRFRQPGEGEREAGSSREDGRNLSLLGGGVLAMLGLMRGSFSGLGLAALGGSMLYRGATGRRLFEVIRDKMTGGGAGQDQEAGRGIDVEAYKTINKSPEELYRFWRNFENFPRFMYYLESVRSLDDKRSHWVARGPFGSRVEWEAETVEDRPNELIRWRSLPGSLVHTTGSVQFRPAPGDRGTEVKVNLRYHPPGGAVAAGVAWLLGQSPQQEVREALRRCKQLLETGEIPTTEGQPSGRGRDIWQQTGFMILENRFARGLGWFSIGLGLTEFLVPGRLGRAIGVDDHETKLRMFGIREITSGLGILTQRQRPAGWVWSRVAGDAMDLNFLFKQLDCDRSEKARVALAIAAVAGVTVLDLLCSMELTRDPHELTGHVPGNGAGAFRQPERARTMVENR